MNKLVSGSVWRRNHVGMPKDRDWEDWKVTVVDSDEMSVAFRVTEYLGETVRGKITIHPVDVFLEWYTEL